MILQNKRLIVIVLTIVGLLLIPFIVMQFTSEVKWGLFDFTLAATLLFGTGLTCELVMRKVKKLQHRIAICGAILVGLLLIWGEPAVGIFGSPIAGS
jgi:peptidoglycan/LPS O-acetylase OafA/YrhL